MAAAISLNKFLSISRCAIRPNAAAACRSSSSCFPSFGSTSAAVRFQGLDEEDRNKQNRFDRYSSRSDIFSGYGFRLFPTRPAIFHGMPGCLQIRTMASAGRNGRPLKYKFRKGRCSKGFKADGSHLSFGTYGIKCCENGRISSRAIEAARRAIIGQFRRKGKVWIRVLADIPITKKPTEVRMGRGKGNVAGWIARVTTGQILFEMDGVSLSDARQAAILASHKLCLPTKFMIYS